MSEQAGREMDALVAEKVMRANIQPCRKIGEPFVIANKDGQFERFIPPYSTTIAAAWDVVERLAERGIFLRIEPGKDLCAVRTWDGVIYEDANTAPLAICLAALKAISNEAP